MWCVPKHFCPILSYRFGTTDQANHPGKDDDNARDHREVRSGLTRPTRVIVFTTIPSIESSTKSWNFEYIFTTTGRGIESSIGTKVW